MADEQERPPDEQDGGTTLIDVLLTARQNEAYEFIKGYIRTYGFPPTVREIGAKLGIKVAPVQDHIEALKRKGAIRHHPGKARAIVILDNVRVQIIERSTK